MYVLTYTDFQINERQTPSDLNIEQAGAEQWKIINIFPTIFQISVLWS